MHVDPAKQRVFIDNANRHIYEIEQIIDVFESRMRALGRDWRDQEFVAFADQTKRTIAVLKEFIAEGRKISQQLAHSAELGEQYQRIQL
jgi:uncharacterized protein YukE